MPVTETVSKRTAYVALNNGTSSTGNVQTVNVSLGSINKDTWDADKAFAIAELLEPCLTKALVAIQSSTTTTLSSGA